MSRSISKDVLVGIHEALVAFRPALLPAFHKLVSPGSIEDRSTSPTWIRGATEASTLTITVSWKDGEPILRALEEIDREASGEVLLFNGLTLDGLIMGWRQFVADTPPPST